MPLINWKISIILTLSKLCVISSATGKTVFAVTSSKLNVLIVTLMTKDNIKLLKHLEYGFKRIVNWNVDQSELTEQAQNRYFDYLIDSSFKGVERLFIFLR